MLIKITMDETAPILGYVYAPAVANFALNNIEGVVAFRWIAGPSEIRNDAQHVIRMKDGQCFVGPLRFDPGKPNVIASGDAVIAVDQVERLAREVYRTVYTGG
jgi:hypothetical protein